MGQKLGISEIRGERDPLSPSFLSPCPAVFSERSSLQSDCGASRNSAGVSRASSSRLRTLDRLQTSQSGFGTVGILALVAIIAVVILGGFFLLSPSSDTSKINSLQTQVEKLEQSAKNGGFTAEDQNTLDDLQADIAKLQTDLPEDTKVQLDDLAEQLDALENSANIAGPKGATGATGATGAQGPAGADGADGCTGDCIFLQASSPGSPQTGHINISGTIIAGQFSGSGASLTGINGSNISSGTVADARLSGNVTLQGSTFNGASQLVQLTAGGILPVLSGANLTSLNGSNISSGTIANARLTNAGSLTVSTGSGLSGGGIIALGDSITLTNSGVLSVTGTTNQITVSASTGDVTFILPQDIAVTSSPTFANLTITTNVTTSTLTYGTSISSSCAGLTGYVWVPGSAKFGTLPGFCVMKYEASNDGSGNAVSVPGAAPYVSISQRTAQDKAIAACSGCHLISEAEWMTIATNALWVNANWCDLTGTNCNNAPGTASRYLATGHQDNSPAAALVASATDSEACYGTVTAGVNTTCGSAGTQIRTLTLSNGAVIWDMPGNVWEWTDGWIIGSEEPNDAVDGFAWHEFTAITKWKDLNYANPTNRGWNSTQRLGQIYTDGTSTNNTLYVFRRGGGWGSGSSAGAFTVHLDGAPTDTGTGIGFRVAR